MIEWSVTGIVVFFLGSCIGSFLNVCIVRMPAEKSIVHPGSHCLQCQKPVRWFDNIPLLSYILLGGKCRYCHATFSFRYFLVELLTGIIFYVFFQYYKFDILIIPYLFMVCGFIVATFVDFKHRIIPDEVSIGGMIAGMIFSLFIPSLHGILPPYDNVVMAHLNSLWLSFLGVLVGGGSIYAMGMLGDFLFKKESMGGGDVKLLAMVGAFLGWKLAILTFFIAPFFGAVFGIIEKIRTNDTTIPYGPFLVLGSIVSLFWGDIIIAWIMSGYGLR